MTPQKFVLGTKRNRAASAVLGSLAAATQDGDMAAAKRVIPSRRPPVWFYMGR